jgi:hypothetical protein
MASTSGIWIMSLFACSLLIGSCGKDDNNPQKAAQGAPQQFAGTLRVRITPEAPTVASDLKAVFNNGNGVTCTWKKNGTVLENEDGSTLNHERFAKHDSITATILKGNEQGSATVIIGNSPPKVASVSTEPAVISAGVDITATAAASDPDGDQVALDYTWNVNGNDIPERGPVLKGSMFKKGDRVFLTVAPSDGEGAGHAFTRVFTVPDTCPVFTSTPPSHFKGTVYTYHAVAVDPDGDAVTYLLGSAPRGMSIDAKTGMVTWQPQPGDVGTHMIEITAIDPEGGKTTQKYSITIE